MIDQNSQFFAILTAVGEAKQANATALGLSWTFAQMGVGDANDTDPIPNRAQTKLINEWRRAPVNQVRPDSANPNIIITEQVIPADVGGKWIRELALYDADGDMVAVANCAPSFKPLLVQGTGKTQVIRMNFIVASTANIVLKIDPAVVLATRSYVDSSIINVLPETRPSGSYTKVRINARGLVVEGWNPATLAGYGIKDAVTRDQITDAGLVDGDVKRPYFRDEKTGGLVVLSVAGHEHDFRDLVNLPETVAEHGIKDVFTQEEARRRFVGTNSLNNIAFAWVNGALKASVDLTDLGVVFTSENFEPSKKADKENTYTRVETDTELKKRVGRDSVITVGLINGDPLRPYVQQEGTNAILPLARADLTDTKLSSKAEADWIDTAGLVGNNPKYPYFRQKGTGTLVSLVPVSELPRNTCLMGVPGWWMCGDTGLIRQKVSVLVGDFGPTFTGSVTWPTVFPRGCDSVKISLRSGNSSALVGSCASYSDATKTGCNWRIEEWGTMAQSAQLTLIIEAEGY